jgi:Undecaprenyl-phosphate glucose phosphotransferase
MLHCSIFVNGLGVPRGGATVPQRIFIEVIVPGPVGPVDWVVPGLLGSEDMERTMNELQLSALEADARPLTYRQSVKVPQAAISGLVAAADAVMVYLVVAAVLTIYQHYFNGAVNPRHAAVVGLGASMTILATMAMRGCYKAGNITSQRTQFSGFTQAWIAAFLLAVWVAFLTKSTSGASRGVFALAFGPGLILVLAGRSLLLQWIRRRLTSGDISLTSAFLIYVGGSQEGEQVVNRLRRNGIAVTGSYRLGPHPFDKRHNSRESALSEASEECRRALLTGRYDAVYMWVPWTEERVIGQLRTLLARVPVPVMLLPDPFVAGVMGGRTIEVGNVTAFEVQRSPLTGFELFVKRLIDVAFAGAGFILLLPVLMIVTLAILVTMGRPALFRQSRKGFGGKRFDILKFRTMAVCENGPEIRQATRNDPRVTPIGAILRRLSIDELPQLWNVVIGDMSLVGPRPHAVAHDDLYDRIIASYAYRHHVKPGITGWAQVNGSRGETRDIKDMEDRINHDVWYINNYSLLLDLKILAKTAILAFCDRKAY